MTGSISTAPETFGGCGTVVSAGISTAFSCLRQLSHRFSTTHLYPLTFLVSVCFISFLRVWRSAQWLGNQSLHVNALGLAHTSSLAFFSQSLHTVSQCSQPVCPGPGTQKSSHLTPQHVVVISRSSSTSLHTLQQPDEHPQHWQQFDLWCSHDVNREVKLSHASCPQSVLACAMLMMVNANVIMYLDMIET